jgi:hypothetical protein
MACVCKADSRLAFNNLPLSEKVLDGAFVNERRAAPWLVAFSSAAGEPLLIADR